MCSIKIFEGDQSDVGFLESITKVVKKKSSGSPYQDPPIRGIWFANKKIGHTTSLLLL